MISVVVPVYNVEKYLKRCLDSILSQTYKEFEIILISDKSKDKSVEICDDYAEKFSNVFSIYGDGMGLAAARKKGVDFSHGEYITFVDPDDYIDINMLQILMDNIMDADIVTSSGISVWNGKKTILRYFSEPYKEFSSNREIIKNYFERKYVDGAIWGKLIKKELFDNVDMCVGAVPGEDICVILQLFDKAKKVRALPNGLYYYVHVDAGISRGGYTKYHKKGLDIYMNTCEKMIREYPEFKTIIAGYICEYEMAVMTAMCRNSVYDIDAIKKLQMHLKKYIREIWSNKYTKLYYKISAQMIIMNYKLFSFTFKSVRKLFGR